MQPPATVAALCGLARHLSLVVLTTGGEVIAATEAAERALQSRPASIVGRAWPELCADPPARTRAYLSQCARTLDPVPGAFQRELDGARIRFRCEGYAVAAPDRPERVIVLQIRQQERQDRFITLGQKIEELNIEIIRRQNSERQLAEARARINTILDQMPAGVLLLEAPSARVVYTNHQAEEIAGGPIGGVDGYSCWRPDGRAYRPEDLPVVRALAGEVVTAEVMHFLRAAEERRAISVNAVPIRDSAGTIVAAVATYYDITEQTRLEQAMHTARAEAETANRAKDEFLAILGHELRNPLAPILTALHLMQLRGVGAEKERVIIERQVRHLARLVDDLLDVSRITNGKIELKREPLELGTVVARAIELVSPLLEKRQHDLAVDLPSRGLLVEADPVRLAQVVSNLLQNAAKYSDPNGRIWVSGRLDAESRQVVLTIRDAGYGIAPEMLPKIFDLFMQERQPLDRSQGGLGLGLAIVRNLVDLHGGTVSIDSEGKGCGTEVTIRLPAIVRQARAGERGSDGRSSSAAGAATSRILVVDDNQDGAELLSEALHAQGHATRVAYDGPGALRIARDFAPQIALLDLGLPVMDGFELARRLREQPGLERIQLIAVTGYGRDEDRGRSSGAGFNAHVVKPVDLDSLEPLIRELLDRQAL